MYKKKSFSSKITPVNMIKSPFSCTVTNVLRNIMFWEVRNVGSTENDCTKWMNPIEIHKSKYDGGFSYNVCYYKKWYRNAEIFIKSNLQLQFVSYNPTITPRGFHVETMWKWPFPRRFNVESTLRVCIELPTYQNTKNCEYGESL